MSTETGNAGKTTRFAIVDRIAAILKLDEAGRIEKFFVFKVKEHNREITKQKMNLDAVKAKHKFAMEALEDKLEDAQANLFAVEEQVTLDDIKTNADMKSFSAKYDTAVDTAEDAIKSLEKEIKEAVEDFGEAKGIVNKTIKLHEERINRIVKK